MHYTIKAEVLDKIRKQNGIRSDEKLAERLGMSRTTLDRIRKKKNIHFDTAIRVLNAADITDIRAATIRVIDEPPAA